MSEYPAGSYKFNPDTKAIAVRTRFPDLPPTDGMTWWIATVGDGGANRSSAEVESWVDIPQDVIDGLTTQEPSNG